MFATWSEVQYELAAECTTNAIKHRAKSVAVDIALYIAGIEMIEHVKDTESDASLELLAAEVECDWARHLKVERCQLREPLRVSRADEFAPLIEQRVGKP